MYRALLTALLTISALVCFSGVAAAQVDEFCREFGSIPSLNSPFANIPFVFGRIELKGLDPGAKFPKVTVVLVDPQQSQRRLTVERSGNYCFRRTANSNGTLIVDVDGVEVARRSIASFGATQQREDFEVHLTKAPNNGSPAVVSARFSHPRSEKSIDLFTKAAEAEKNRDLKKAIGFLIEVVTSDPADFIAWTKLGSLHFEQKAFAEADAAFRKALELRVDYTPAWINVGKMRVFQKQYAAAIEIFKQAISTDPVSARGYQLLGEAYLQNKQGSLAVEALNQAIKLDPQGMAECHLLLARLYDLAGVKKAASHEFKLFLMKVPDHADKKKLEKYIKDNPE